MKYTYREKSTKFLDKIIDSLIEYKIPTNLELKDTEVVRNIFEMLSMKESYKNYFIEKFNFKSSKYFLRPLTINEIQLLPQRVRGAAEYFLIGSILGNERTIFYIGPYKNPVGIINSL